MQAAVNRNRIKHTNEVVNQYMHWFDDEVFEQCPTWEADRGRHPGGYEIAAGHHRVEAAKRAGLTEAEIFVGDFDDQTMVRIYARENATQRSKQSTAIDGSVLASVRWLARQLLGGISPDFRRYGVFESEKAFECAQGNLLSDKGIGQDLIGRVLKDMPGMTRNSIGDSLGRLKSSGDYARTLLNITRQIEAEAEAARLEAERLERERLAAARPFPPVPMGVHQRQKLYKNCTL